MITIKEDVDTEFVIHEWLNEHNYNHTFLPYDKE